MGLDIYVGSLTRYYCRDWKTVIERLGEELGVHAEKTHPPPPEDAITDPDEIHVGVLAWRSGLASAAATIVSGPWDWDEDPTSPYYTDKLGWYGYNGLQMLAACKEMKLRLPKELPADLNADNAWLEARKSKRYAHLFHPAVWLPLEFDTVFETRLPTDARVDFGSAPRLVWQLRDLNARTLKGSASDLERWRRSDEFPDAVADWTLEIAAKYGLAVFLRAAERAVDNRLPMLLDW